MSLSVSLEIWQNDRQLIKSFDASFLPKEICALVGNNGAGKSTLLKTIAGLLPIKRGLIRLGEQELNKMSPQSKARHISFLQQTSVTHPYCLAQSRIAHGLVPIFGCDFFIEEEQEKMIEDVAKRLNISHLLKKPLAQMSGGEERLVHLAKCLVNPHIKILLLDEPSVFLDFTQQENLVSCLKEEAKNGKTIIFSSHDRHFISQLAHRGLLIENQRLMNI